MTGYDVTIITSSSHVTLSVTWPFDSYWLPIGNKTAELSQRRPRDAPNRWVPWKVLRVLTTHRATFPEICNGLLFRLILRTCVQKLKFVALPVPEKSTLHFLPKFGRAFDRMDLVNIPAKVEVRSFIRSWDNRGYSKNFWQSLYTPTLHFLPNF